MSKAGSMRITSSPGLTREWMAAKSPSETPTETVTSVSGSRLRPKRGE
jgi:hypothetical protein